MIAQQAQLNSQATKTEAWEPLADGSKSGTQQAESDDEGDMMEDMGQHLLEDMETMVEELVSWKPVADSSLRQTAPAFVPGQLWTGTEQPPFED